jgi:hypothetical protein
MWSSEQLPAETVAAVRAELATLAQQISAAVAAESPVYGEVLAAPEGMAIRLGIEQAIRAFLDGMQSGRRPAIETDELWRRLGEAEFQAGRSLDDLRAAFRTGTRAAWRGAADLALRAGVSARVAISMAEAIFVYADDLAADVVEGYLRIQSDEAGERERRRRRVAQLLLDHDGADPDAIAHAAQLARWPLPRLLAAVAISGDAAAAVARRLDAAVLAGADSEGGWLLVGDPDGPGRRAALEQALAPVAAAIGPAVDPRDAGRSLRWARATLAIGERQADAHLATLVLLADRELALELAARRLEPLLVLAESERARLIETLTAWLDHQRHTPRAAQQLHVHPQTVRYRLARLTELLGEALRTPDGRFELELALRIRRALEAHSATGGG